MMVLVMQADAALWDSLVFDGIEDVDVEAVTAVFGMVDGPQHRLHRLPGPPTRRRSEEKGARRRASARGRGRRLAREQRGCGG
ncbi:hypothetical protein [Streptomyces sp. NPDC058086]|uniref:hypothetical protein n=1 Tax=Streptomyces sp. NPDC058086 TaxID=3346334 RepID=UPI0036E8BC1F